MSRSNCKDCGQPIQWARTSNDGYVPLDPDPHPLGSIVLDSQDRTGSWDGARPNRAVRYMKHRCKDRP